MPTRAGNGRSVDLFPRNHPNPASVHGHGPPQEIVGEGWQTQGSNTPTIAIRERRSRARAIRVTVTLEHCCHRAARRPA